MDRTKQETVLEPRRYSLQENLQRHKYLWMLAVVGLLFYVIFKYLPMFGVIVAFKDYKPWVGVFRSEWVGLYHFRAFFRSIYLWRLIRNTLVISFSKLIFGFPIPILFAVLLVEVRNKVYKRTVQTVTYFPHFLSWVVVGGFFISFLSPSTGPINAILGAVGLDPIPFMMSPPWFIPVIVATSVWKEFGWQSIVYLAAISSIDPQLYEAARIDGANKFQEVLRITIPHVIPIAVILLVLRIGHILSEDFQQILMFLQGNPLLYEVGDVIETYVYRVGILGDGGSVPRYSYAAAVGLFKNFTGLLLVLAVNRAAKLLGQEALW